MMFRTEPMLSKVPSLTLCSFWLCSFRWLCLVFACWLLRPAYGAANLSDEALANISFDQKLGSQLSLNLPFRDETGADVRLGKYFNGKPVILVLGYYQCPMLCTLVLNGLVEGLQDLKWSIGGDFEIIDVTINPAESPNLAAAKKRTYLKQYGRPSAAEGWHFLTGDQSSIERLTGEVGFRYAYDTSSKQYAHPSGLVILTPQGRVASYLFGVTFSPKDLYNSLQTAAKGVGTPVQKLILLCFHYNPITGKYGPAIIFSVRLLGIATVVGLVFVIVFITRRGRPVSGLLVSVSGEISKSTEPQSAELPHLAVPGESLAPPK